MADKKKLAYYVTEDYEGHGVIVFATSSIAARREGANELNVDFSEVESCRRAKWADQYVGSKIPTEAYIENGWWFECHHCGSRVDEETEGRVIKGNRVFCNEDCQHAHQAEVDAQNKSFEEFKVQILKARPDLILTRFSGEWPCLTLSADFTFDGGKYGGHVRKDGDEWKWFVANGDREAWERYESSRQEQRPADSGKGEQ